jgi:arginyl-tRNA synthetase
MYPIQQAKTQVIQALKTAVGNGFVPSPDELVAPPDASMGDVSFACFSLGKKLKRNPAEIACEIAAKIGPKGYIASVKDVGPYVNFRFDTVRLGESVLAKIDAGYGSTKIGKDIRVMVEFANLNTHKDVHIGHLRNLFLGQAVVNLLKNSGFDVIPVAYINDLGLHVAQSVWAIKMKHDGEEVALNDRIDFLRRVYVEANEAIEKNPEVKQQISEVFRALETLRGSEIALWKKTRKWSLDYLRKVYDELELTIDHWYFESELITKTKKIIDGLIKKGIVVQSQGAWIVDLQDEGLGVNLLIKSDGTLLYNAKDLGLALKKEEDYHCARSIYVVDARQSHAIAQLFATLKRMGFERELTHLSYDFVTLEEGAMASRKGNVIRFEALRDEMIDEARAQTLVRHEKMAEKDVERISKAVASSATRFGMLKQDSTKKIIFNMKDALSFDGFTGPYLLYTYARIQSLLKKANKKHLTKKAETLVDNHSHDLIVKLAMYPEVLFHATQNLEPAQLAQYLFDLAKSFSGFYEHVPVLQAPEIEKGERLALANAVGEVLKNGLGLLGIKPVEEM